jgi:8-oxo-dGTP pyrophosphatase MutT (NUDIX family)
VESGESLERALRRELREELGVGARIARLLGSWPERYGPGGFPILALVYAARLEGEPRAGSDVAEVRWFRPGALPWRDIAFPSVRMALRRHLASARGPARAGRRRSARRTSR